MADGGHFETLLNRHMVGECRPMARLDLTFLTPNQWHIQDFILGFKFNKLLAGHVSKKTLLGKYSITYVIKWTVAGLQPPINVY